MSSPEALRKLGDMVEALRDVEGIEVDQSMVEEVPDSGNPMEAMFGQMMGSEMATKEKLIITADMVEESEQGRPDYPDDPDIEEMEEDTESIPIQ